jgi:hypothetical protein
VLGSDTDACFPAVLELPPQPKRLLKNPLCAVALTLGDATSEMAAAADEVD